MIHNPEYRFLVRRRVSMVSCCHGDCDQEIGESWLVLLVIAAAICCPLSSGSELFYVAESELKCLSL